MPAGSGTPDDWLEGIPECALHGYVAGFTEVELRLIAGEPAAAVDAARRVQDIGRRFDTPSWWPRAFTARVAP